MNTPEHRPDPAAQTEFMRKRRTRNYATLAVLVTLVALFYAIAIIRMTQAW